jgi:hypothetical protein
MSSENSGCMTFLVAIISSGTFTFTLPFLGIFAYEVDLIEMQEKLNGLQKEVDAIQVEPDVSRDTNSFIESERSLSREENSSQPKNSNGNLSSTPNSARHKKFVIQSDDGVANLRSSPSTEVKTLAKITNGTPILILGRRENSSKQLWYEVEVNGQKGWIFSELVKQVEQ